MNTLDTHRKSDFGAADQIVEPVLQISYLDIALPKGADRRFAAENISLTIYPGQTLCIVGESGSGKSTVADAVMGLLPKPHLVPTRGRIVFQGQDLLALAEDDMRTIRGSKIGMIFQEPMTALNPVMTIGDQMAEIFDAHMSVSNTDKRLKIIEALSDVGLPEPERIINTYPFRLSGGQRQRVIIAAALLLEPALLIADEPTTALDVTTQAQILNLIKRLQKKRNTAVLFITHDFGVVSEIADEVMVMQLGKLVESGSADAVLRNPQHDYTRKLLAAIPNGECDFLGVKTGEKPLLRVNSLCKTYRTGRGLFGAGGRVVQAARDISFDLQPGETLGLVGESGSGKSSVGRCIVGLAGYDAGQIEFNGKPLPAGKVAHRETAGKIQMIFQDPYASLNPRHKIGDAIAAGPIAMGIDKAKAHSKVSELLELVGLKKEASERYPHEFSGGQRQRIGIARALAMEPKLIVADEPVSALDVSVQAQVLDLFARIRDEFQLAMVFITHDLRVARQMCNRIAVMQRGSIIEYGETATVLSSPQQEYTRKLMDAVLRLPNEKRG